MVELSGMGCDLRNYGSLGSYIMGREMNLDQIREVVRQWYSTRTVCFPL